MFKNLMFQIAGTLVAVAVLAYLILHTVSSFENELEVKNAYYTTMDLTFDSTAYIFKDEVVVSTDKGNNVSYIIENGKKVSINQKIASVFSDPSAVEAQNRIYKLEKEIEYIEALVKEATFSTPPITSIDKDINERLPSISKFATSGDIKNALNYANENIYDLELKYCILKGTVSHTRLIEERKAEISQLKSQLPSQIASIYSPYSGYFYNETDGYENYFNFDAVENLSSSSFDNLKECEASNEVSIGKISKNAKWYIAFELNTETAVKLSLNSKYSVIFSSSGRSIPMKVEKRIDSSSSDYKIVVMSSNTVYDDFNFSRKQTISVTIATYSGLAFPAKAVHTDYDQTGASKIGVYVLDETVVRFKTFNKLMEKNGLVLCEVPDSKNISLVSDEKLSLYDTVIVEGTNLYNNKVIKNVLKTK